MTLNEKRNEIHDTMINTLEYIRELFSIYERKPIITTMLRRFSEDIDKMQYDLMSMTGDYETEFTELCKEFEDVYDKLNQLVERN